MKKFLIILTTFIFSIILLFTELLPIGLLQIIGLKSYILYVIILPLIYFEIKIFVNLITKIDKEKESN